MPESASTARERDSPRPPAPQAEVSLTGFLDATVRLLATGDIKQAEARYRGALVPWTPALANLGMIAMQRGCLDAALAFLAVACELTPGIEQCWTEYGRALLIGARHAEAARALERAIAADDSAAEAHALLGVAYGQENRNSEAEVHFERATSLDPDCGLAWRGLGMLRIRDGRFTQAASAFERSLEISPDDADAWNSLGVAFSDQGRVAEGSAAFRRALEIEPDLDAAAQNRLFYANCSPDLLPDDIASMHRDWGRRAGGRGEPEPKPHGNPREPERRLRVGYVSAEFNEHPVAFFMRPLLAAHDRRHFEAVCFANGGSADWMTSLLRANADGWHDIGSMTDSQVTELVQQERIDILVDLAGAAAGNRASLFSRATAPVQVTYLGYPNTTGLATVQYRITDAFADPPGATEKWHVEQLVRPFSSFLCYEPPPRCPEVLESPCMKNGFITFGCFNHFRKLNGQTFERWCRILHAVPGSRLLLKCGSLVDESCRRQTVEWLAQNGISSERLHIVPFQPSLREHLQCYGEVDVALDTFPYNGTTTTCEALWMGVPVVSRAGVDHRSRVGSSLLNNAGLPHLVAETDDQFVATAVTLALQPEALAALRRNLRSTLRSSPLLDASGFTAALEASYRTMWRNWCAGDGSHVSNLPSRM